MTRFSHFHTIFFVVFVFFSVFPSSLFCANLWTCKILNSSMNSQLFWASVSVVRRWCGSRWHFQAGEFLFYIQNDKDSLAHIRTQSHHKNTPSEWNAHTQNIQIPWWFSVSLNETKHKFVILLYSNFLDECCAWQLNIPTGWVFDLKTK